MNFGKILIVLITLFAVLGTFSFASSLALVSAQNGSSGGNNPDGTWINGTSNVFMSDLTATICVTIKNTKDHVEVFKISQTYTDTLENPISWTVDWTDPPASKMINVANTTLPGGDLGWEIQPGETKTVSFKLKSLGAFGSNPAIIVNKNAEVNTYWPLIPDMGTMASWFMPNEIEMLNPNLQLESWTGTFTFTATNTGSSETVVGILRAPIVPTDSILTGSNPEVTYVDKDMALGTSIAAWNVHLAPDDPMPFAYSYKWIPGGAAVNTTVGNGSSSPIPTTAAKNVTTVPSRTTGVPYGLLAIAILVVAAGLGYAKFLR